MNPGWGASNKKTARDLAWFFLFPLLTQSLAGLVRDGPGADGAWPADKFIWFRLHQYANGQLGPGAMMQGLIQVEL